MGRYEFKLPDLGEGTVSSEIVQWRVAQGDVVAENAPLVELATEKAVVEVTAPVSGTVVALNGQPGDDIPVGSVLVVFETNAGGAATAPIGDATVAVMDPAMDPAVPVGPRRRQAGDAPTRVMTSPVVRRLAREFNIDLTQVHGSGPQGRIERVDIEAWIAHPEQAHRATGEARPASVETAETDAMGAPDVAIRRVPVIGVRRVIAERMVKAMQSIPHITYVEEVDLTHCDEKRRALNSRLQANEAAYTFLPLVIEALTRVLPRHPRLNAHYDPKDNVILEYDAVHVGIATHTPDGLKVPVLKHAERLTLAQTRDQLNRLSERARTNQATRAELTGSTITITSLGKLGGVVSTPIINPPEVAIIGLNQAKPAVVVQDGQTMVIRLMMNISASFDHRFVDGYDGALFIQDLKQELERV